MATLMYVLLCAIALLFQTSIATEPLFHICSNPTFRGGGDPYKTSLNTLLVQLQSQTPPSGFSRAVVGEAHGLALCRGDVSSPNCQSCLLQAIFRIRMRCPSSKAAVIWYDNCMVKYANSNFFGQLDYSNKFFMSGIPILRLITPDEFNKKTVELLNQIAGRAPTSPKLYARGQMDLGDIDQSKVYAMVQCTRDLSAADCKKCLDDKIRQLHSCCDAREGGRVVDGSCGFRYETYWFLQG